MKVEDIRPESAMTGQAAAQQLDVDWLADRARQFVHAACPACGLDAPTYLYTKYGMRHVLCECRTQYVTPRPTGAMLAEFYAQSANYAYWAKYVFPASANARRALFRRRAQHTASLPRDIHRGTMVEVGAAYGWYCEEVRALDLFDSIVAIEPTPDLANQCRSQGFEVVESSYERAELNDVALIAAFEVIEHLYDPGHFLRWCHGALARNGVVLMTCPNIRGFETMILGAESGAVDHEHINLFTPESLTLLLRNCGFEPFEVSTPGELDVDIVRRSGKDVGPFLSACVERGEGFQRFLHENRLSSNLRIAARAV